MTITIIGAGFGGLELGPYGYMPLDSARVGAALEGRYASALGAVMAQAGYAGNPRDLVAAAGAALVLIGGNSSLLACPVCFGAEETSMIDGAKVGVMVMLAITFAVQGGFVGFFLYLRKRAKLIADADLDNEWSELQGSPKTS